MYKTCLVQAFGYHFTSNGCTSLPYSSMFPACLIHDLDYTLGGSSTDRFRADERLLGNIRRLDEVPKVLKDGAGLMYLCVSLFGRRQWNSGRLYKRPTLDIRPWTNEDYDINNLQYDLYPMSEPRLVPKRVNLNAFK